MLSGTLKSPFVAAPMAGVTSLPFRLSLKKGGAALVCSEMVSAAGLIRRQPHTMRLLRSSSEEQPLLLQLFGAEPVVMEKAARLARQEFKMPFLDINMGCPAAKVRRTGAGSALLDTPLLAGEILDAASQGFAGPVSVKIRLGYSRNSMEEFLPYLERAAAITLHARTVTQGYAGRAYWPAIAWLKRHCPMPVIGNGDVDSARAAVAMLEQTGCDGVMIGRACLHDPFIFAHAQALRLGKSFSPPGAEELRRMLQAQADLALELEGEALAIHLVRQFIMWKVRGRPGVSNLRRQAGQSKSLGELLEIADNYFFGQETGFCG